MDSTAKTKKLELRVRPEKLESCFPPITVLFPLSPARRYECSEKYSAS